MSITTSQHSNRLVDETSPYLLQHAHNPVNWYPWGDEAMKRSRQENKPILVSIGYSACHWCHVMERESFENEETAAFMNENFVNIKIDREERPDLDHIYMDAVQAMTGSGGWPLNVFLTPDGKPFFGGTYFPPKRAFNRASWMETLASVAATFKERRHEVDAQAENLTAHLLQGNDIGKAGSAEGITRETIDAAVKNLQATADTIWGGFGKAPKFPQTFSIQFLLRNYYVNRNESARAQALLSIDKMIDGGLYDQLRAGFARYSTDEEWLAPHFEKMLYDNALLLVIIAEAFQLTRNTKYERIIHETMQFISREMSLESEAGVAFYSALDADSEGVEGKFYVWSKNEVDKILGVDAELFCAYYDVTEQGNWEHSNILRVLQNENTFAAERGITTEELLEKLENSKAKLRKMQDQRIRPGLDDKIILGWNALMNSACSAAFSATGEQQYRALAIANMNFLLNAFKSDNSSFFHTWKNGNARYPAFLDDYAYLVRALIDLQEITGNPEWLEEASGITSFVLSHFSADDGIHFFYTGDYQEDVIVRKKELYDGAVPSGNSVMAYNLYKLSILLDGDRAEGWKERSLAMAGGLAKLIGKYPGSFGHWATLLQEMLDGTAELAITGTGHAEMRDEVMKEYIPHRVLMSAEKADKRFPLLAGKESERTAVFLCRNYTCQQPVFSAEELIRLINSGPKTI